MVHLLGGRFGKSSMELGSCAVHDVDVHALAASLTWTGERLYYLAACGVPPFDDRAVLVDTLTHLWVSALYD